MMNSIHSIRRTHTPPIILSSNGYSMRSPTNPQKMNKKKHFISTSLPPKLQGDALGTLTVTLKRFEMEMDCRRRTTCRISFWGQDDDHFFDIASDDMHGNNGDESADGRQRAKDPTISSVSIEYPLVGTMEGVSRYLTDMNILSIPVFQTIHEIKSDHDDHKDDAVVVGQGNVSLPPIVNQFKNKLSSSLRTKAQTNTNANDPSDTTTSFHDIHVPVISIPTSTALTLNHPYQCQQIGEMHLELMFHVKNLNVRGRKDAYSSRITGGIPDVSSISDQSIKSNTNKEALSSLLVRNQCNDTSNGINTSIQKMTKSSPDDDLEESFITLSHNAKVEEMSAPSIYLPGFDSESDSDPDHKSSSFSLATEDDSIFMEAIMMEGTSAAATTTNPIKEISEQVAKVRFVKLEIQSLLLSARLLQPVLDIISSSAGNCYKVQCWLQLQVPPLVALPPNCSDTIRILVFERDVGDGKVPWNYSGERRIRNPHHHHNYRQSRGQQKQKNPMEGFHNVSYSTLWNIQFHNDFDVNTFSQSSLKYDLIAKVERMRESMDILKSSQQNKQIHAKKEFYGSKSIKLASATVKLGHLFSHKSLELNLNVPLCLKDSRLRQNSSHLSMKLCLLPDRYASFSREHFRKKSLKNLTNSVLDGSSVDLIEDTIISLASRSNYHVLETQPAKALTGIVDDTKEESNSNSDEKLNSPLWTYFLLTTRDAPAPFDFIRIKTACTFPCSKTGKETCLKVEAEQILHLDTAPGKRSHLKCFRLMTMINHSDFSMQEKVNLNAKLWTEKIAGENQSDQFKDSLLGTMSISFRIPDKLRSPSIHPIAVEYSSLQVKERIEFSFPMTLAVGSLKQIKMFAKLTETAIVVQRWWIRTCLLIERKLTKSKSLDNCLTIVLEAVPKHLTQKAALTIQTFWQSKRKNTNELLLKNTYPCSNKIERVEATEILKNEKLDENKLKRGSDGGLDTMNVGDQNNKRTNIDTTTNPHSTFCEGSNKSIGECNQEEADPGLKDLVNNIQDKPRRCFRKFYPTREVTIHFGHCTGLRELISLWADSGARESVRAPLTFDAIDWDSCGILITFSILSRSGLNNSSISSSPKTIHFSSGISRVNTNSHSIDLDHQVSFSIDNCPEIESYLRSEELACKLWFIPVISNEICVEFPTSNGDEIIVPQDAALMCTTGCPLTVLLKEKSTASYLCPWTFACDLSFQHHIGNVRITIGRTELQTVFPTIDLCTHDESEARVDIFKWDLPDTQIDAAITISQKKQNTIKNELSCPSIQTNKSSSGETEQPNCSLSSSTKSRDSIAKSEANAENFSTIEQPKQTITTNIVNVDSVTSDDSAYSEGESLSGRNLDSVLASLVLVTNALPNETDNSTGKEAQSHGFQNRKLAPSKNFEISRPIESGDISFDAQEQSENSLVSWKSIDFPAAKMTKRLDDELKCKKKARAANSFDRKVSETDKILHHNFSGESKHFTSVEKMEDPKQQQLSRKMSLKLRHEIDLDDSSDDSGFFDRTRLKPIFNRQEVYESSSSSSSDYEYSPKRTDVARSKIKVAISSRNSDHDSSSDSSSIFKPRQEKQISLQSCILSDYSSDSSTFI